MLDVKISMRATVGGQYNHFEDILSFCVMQHIEKSETRVTGRKGHY